MVPLVYLALAFKAWMFIDAIKRKAPMLWFVVLLFPFGSVIYFAAVKLPDFGIRPAHVPDPDAGSQPDLDALRTAASESPSFDNRMALGFGLLAENLPLDARDAFEAALSSHPRDKSALLAFSQASIQVGDPQAAVEPLSKIVDQRFEYQDYQAAKALAVALAGLERQDEALQLAARIAHSSQRYQHRLDLAELQVHLGKSQEAKATLCNLLTELEADSPAIHQDHAALASKARILLRSLSA